MVTITAPGEASFAICSALIKAAAAETPTSNPFSHASLRVDSQFRVGNGWVINLGNNRCLHVLGAFDRMQAWSDSTEPR
jgi:hypothetical protein